MGEHRLLFPGPRFFLNVKLQRCGHGNAQASFFISKFIDDPKLVFTIGKFGGIKIKNRSLIV